MMKAAYFVLKSAWKNLAVFRGTLILLVGILCTMLLMAMLFGAYGMGELVALEGNQEAKRTYTIYTNGNKMANADVIDEILFGTTYPKAEKMKEALVFQSFVFLNGTISESALLSGDLSEEQIETTTFKATAVMPKEQQLYECKPEIIRGRWFTDEELLYGEQVLVLNDDWLKEHGYEQNITDVTIEHVEYKVVGVAKYEPSNTFMLYQNYIPYYTALKVHETGGFTADYRIHVVFEESLTAQQCQSMFCLLGFRETNRSFRIESEYVTTMRNSNGILYINMGILAVLFCLCALNLSGIFRYMLSRTTYQLMIYKLCGGKQRICRMVLLTTAGYVAVFSVTAANVLFPLLAKVLSIQLSWRYRWMISILFGLILIASVLPTIRRYGKVMPLDEKMWYS